MNAPQTQPAPVVGWATKALGSIVSLQRGHDLPDSQRRYGHVPVMSAAGRAGMHDTALVRGPGLVIGRSGASIGQVHYCAEDFWPHNTCMYATDFHGNDPLFTFYFLQSLGLSRYNSGGAQPSLNRNFIYPILVNVPQLSEQRAIAAALSDMDGLIWALEDLMAKKRAIKQAAMQQLLTGKTRLPGFTADWESKKLGSFASIRNQKVLPSSVPPDTPCVELENIAQNEGRLLTCSIARESASVKYSFRAGDVLFGRLRSYLRKFWLADRDGICTTEIWPLTPDPRQAVPGFLHALVQTEHFIEAAGASYGTHMPRADWAVMRNLEVCLPNTDEQAAIAEVLSDMDAEIEAREQRLDKTKLIKQGMMQQLLTGRVRLVMPQAADTQADGHGKASKPHSWAFNEAVVISMLTKNFGSEQFPLGRKRYTKLSYLLHRHVERQAEGYLKKAAGPYNPKTKYGGPERIALENGYIREHNNGRYGGFVAADNIAQAEAYFEKWYGPNAIPWLNQFRFKKNDDLELLATVDMAAEELYAGGKPVDVAGVKAVIHGHPEWQAKLGRSVFSDTHIQATILQCQKLFRGS